MHDHHIIHKVTLDINVTNKGDAYSIKDNIGGFLKSEVFPYLEELISNQPGFEKIPYALQIDNLTIDVQSESAVLDFNLKENISEQFQTALKDMISEALSVKTNLIEKQSGVRLLDESSHFLSAFLYFIKEGVNPWWNRNDMNQLLTDSTVLQQAISAEHFVKELVSLLEYSEPRRRLVNQLSEKSLILVLKSIVNDVPQIDRLVDMIQWKANTLEEKKKFWTLFLDFLYKNQDLGLKEVVTNMEKAFFSETSEVGHAEYIPDDLSALNSNMKTEVLKRKAEQYLKNTKNKHRLKIFLNNQSVRELIQKLSQFKGIVSGMMQILNKEENSKLKEIFLDRKRKKIVSSVKSLTVKTNSRKHNESETESSDNINEKYDETNVESAVRKILDKNKVDDQEKAVEKSQFHIRENQDEKTGASKKQFLENEGSEDSTGTNKNQSKTNGLEGQRLWQKELEERKKSLSPFRKDDKSLTSNKGFNTAENDLSYHIKNAGLIIAHPFLPHLLKRCELLTEDNELTDPALSAHLLHFVASGKVQQYESEMVFEKFLCNIPARESISREVELPEKMKEEAEKMINALVQNWEAMKGASPDLIRNEFFQRPGKIDFGDDASTVTVERKTQDILLDRIPWGLGLVKLPWKAEFIYTHW